MKPIKLFVFALIVIAALSMEGCTTMKWSVDFTKPAVDDLGDWNKQEESAGNDYQHDTTGLYFDGFSMTAPYGFSGDFTMKVKFSLDTGIGDVIPRLSFILIDGYCLPGQLLSEEHIEARLNNVGDSGSDYYDLYDNGTSKDYNANIEGLWALGDNEFVMKRIGNNIEVWINEQTQLSYVANASCYLEYAYPCILLDTAALKQIRLKSISVGYDGEKQPLY